MAGEGPAGAPRARGLGADLTLLLDDERGRPAQPLLEALLDKRSEGESSAIRAAADRLLRRHAPGAVDLAPAADALIQRAGDERSRRLFVAFCLERDGRSQGQLGAREGISATRVGQIIQGAEHRVRAALAASTGSLPWAVRSFRRQAGGVMSDGRRAAVLVRVGAGQGAAAQLLPWLAGPYIPLPDRPGWSALQSRAVVPRTRTALTADGGVRRLADVTADLADLEVDGQQLVLWLGANGATVIHDLAVVVGGPLADAVERVLDAHGEPRTEEEIAADLADGGRTVDPSSVRAAVRQGRFARLEKGAIGLAAWPAAEEPAVEPRRPGRRSRGRPPGPSPAVPAGRTPGAGEPAGARPEPAAPGTDRMWLWVRVDADVLRGCEAVVPGALMEGLGLSPLTRCTFSSRWGPVTLAYDRPQPTRGSVRAIALAAGARSDDSLLLGFSGSSRDVVVQVRHGSALMDRPEGTSVDVTLFPEVASGGTR